VNAVEMTDAVQVVVPPRWSETVTTPSGPAIVLDVTEEVCDPRETLAVGALMDNVPATSVNVTGVVAPAGRAITAASVAAVLRSSKKFRMSSRPFFRLDSKLGQATALI
jgi:hypothetical protein